MDLRAAETLINDLMRKYGLPEQGWTFKWDRALRRNGQCNYTTKTISLSKVLTEDRSDAAVRNTILHEIAHAMTPGHRHDRMWQYVFMSIGGDGKRRSDDVVPKEVMIKRMKWAAVCANGHEHYRMRMTKKLQGMVCGAPGHLTLDSRRLNWKENR